MKNTSRLLKFESLDNIRDLGGIKAADGRSIISGKLIRCGNLSGLTGPDRDKLKELVTTVVDMRTKGERDEKPDEVIEGLEYIHLPVMETLSPGVTREEASDAYVVMKFLSDPQGAREYMCGMYRTFAKDRSSVSQYASFIRLLLKNRPKALLWHCTAGKDRAGIAAAIIEEILSVEREDIIADYLTTNDHLKKNIEVLKAMVKARSGIDNRQADEALKYLFGAEEEYINEFYKAAEEEFGSTESYIKKGLGLTDEEIKLIRDTYLR